VRLGGRAALAVALAALCLGCSAPGASAHASLISSDPAAGSSLGATPTEITLSLSERPVAALSSIVVTGARGSTYEIGRPEPTSGDPLTIAAPIRPLPRGVYTVKWRVDSAVDGHATTGAYQFGVQVSPAGAGATSARPRSVPVTSTLELVARWILLLGLVALIAAARSPAPASLRSPL
jgi:methionine-rich copper-binding protein CopC